MRAWRRSRTYSERAALTAWRFVLWRPSFTASATILSSNFRFVGMEYLLSTHWRVSISDNRKIYSLGKSFGMLFRYAQKQRRTLATLPKILHRVSYDWAGARFEPDGFRGGF